MGYKRSWRAAPGGLSVYWAIMIGIILVSAYLVGGLIPERIPPPVKGQKMSFKPPNFTDKHASLQMRSLGFNGCRGMPGVLILVDASENMVQPASGKEVRKLDIVKTTLLDFGNRLSDQAIVGITTYSDPLHNDPNNLLPMKKLGEHRGDYERVVSNLGAGGLTYVRHGVESARDTLKKAIKNNKEYEFNLVIISNSIPRTAVCLTEPNNSNCSCKGGNNCFAKDQDPTTNPNLGKELKEMGVNVYTIGIGDYSNDDKIFTDELKKMLKDLSSSPENRYVSTTPDADKLSEILGSIGDNLCLEEAKTPSFAIAAINPSPTPTPSPRPTARATVRPTARPTQKVAQECKSFTVPGTSDMWLAGMPNGSTASSVDKAPDQSPVRVQLGIQPGMRVRIIRASGGITYLTGSQDFQGPEGGSNPVINHWAGAQNGIANTEAKVVSLMGVFLGPDNPSKTAAPATRSFGTVQSRNFLTLRPLLKQPFFIGDGKASNGDLQGFIAPPGATRLFLGVMDGQENKNNKGSFSVRVCNF